MDNLEAGNQTGTETTSTDVSTSGNQTEAEQTTFNKEIDEMWGIETPEVEEETPDEEEETETEELEEEETPEEQEIEEETETNEDDQQEDLIELLYLDEKVSKPLEEVKKLAQRGMNASRIERLYGELKHLAPLVEQIELLSAYYGVSKEETIKNMNAMEAVKQAEIQRLMERGTDEEDAREIIESKFEAARAKREANKSTKNQSGLSAQQIEQIEAFGNMRPDIHEQIQKGEFELPKEVTTDWANGNTLIESWLNYEIKGLKEDNASKNKEIKSLQKEKKRLETEIKKITKKQENKAKAPTSKHGLGGGASSFSREIEDLWRK